MLTLPERLLLISIDDQGKPHDPKSSLGPALAGAALTELLLAGQLRNDDDRVVATTAGPTGEALLDQVVAEIVVRSDRARSSGGCSAWRRTTAGASRSATGSSTSSPNGGCWQQASGECSG